MRLGVGLFARVLGGHNGRVHTVRLFRTLKVLV